MVLARAQLEFATASKGLFDIGLMPKQNVPPKIPASKKAFIETSRKLKGANVEISW